MNVTERQDDGLSARQRGIEPGLAADTASTSDASAIAEAADWYARLHVEDVTAEDRLAFARWEAADPNHALAWKGVSRASEALDQHDAPRDDPALVALRAATRRRLSTRPLRSATLVGAIALAIGAGAIGLMRRDPATAVAPVSAMVYATDAVGRRDIRLADGTWMTLDARSRVRVMRSATNRLATLDHGRAFFAVARGGMRPFVVLAGGNRVVTRRGRFGVHLTSAGVAVDLVAGQAVVETLAIARTTTLVAGNRLLVRDGSQRIDATGADRATDWRTGPLTATTADHSPA